MLSPIFYCIAQSLGRLANLQLLDEEGNIETALWIMGTGWHLVELIY